MVFMTAVRFLFVCFATCSYGGDEPYVSPKGFPPRAPEYTTAPKAWMP